MTDLDAAARDVIEQLQVELHRVGGCEGGQFDDVDYPHSELCEYASDMLAALLEGTPWSTSNF